MRLIVRRCARLFLVGAATCLILPANASSADDDAALLKQAQEIFGSLPKDIVTAAFPVTPARVELGRALFFDARVSVDGSVSCASCHQPAHYGADNLPRSRGPLARTTAHHALTVFNAALQTKQGWRGDFANVEEQAIKSLVEPTMLGAPSNDAAMSRLKSIAGYRPLFEKAFPGEAEPVTPENWSKAVGAFERTLVTPSPFDRFLAGDVEALSSAEKTGLRKFIDNGCMDCHSGPGVGGGMLQKFGLAENYWKETHSAAIDKGRFALTGKRGDLYVFKVPTLRNVAMTAPYFHDGSISALEDAVRIMAKLQVQTALSPDDVRDIVAFLKSLTGDIPQQFAPPPPIR